MPKRHTLKTVTVFGLLPDNIKNRIDQLGTFGIVTFSPVVSGTRLAKNKVVRSEDLTIGTRSETVHGTGLKIHEHSPWNEPATTCFIVIDIDPLKLEIGIALVTAGGINAVFRTNHLPELGTDLVAALASLDVKNLTHFFLKLN
ncbi:hypothetical protein Ccrd_003068 [Cynara cardunculus var. scolymus]|uniref:Uncharacterized protein n=1 Tax=Cynara cardunculus var. scolymus TaxID=59895 RepID=A0A103XQ47_CYNCS|nr:hypothetical protein Ccrd_003068 [Cynara cardunculus var. scolymus]